MPSVARADADVDVDEATPRIVPPRLLTPVVAPYPAGAEGDAAVTLAVTVDASGNVADVRVLDGIEPFGAAAIESMHDARFVPGTREGRPVPVVVRFRVDFTKPVLPAVLPAETSEPNPN